jgi:Domain of unknown function (DUF4411)
MDTSSLLEAWVRSYRPKNFPTFWQLLEGLIARNRCVVCEEVKSEIDRFSDELAVWLRNQPDFIVAFDSDEERIVKKVMREYSKLINIKKNKGWADPFVIALDYSKGLAVVTEEGPGTAEGPKIPFVCNVYGTECMSLVDMIERENWKF